MVAAALGVVGLLMTYAAFQRFQLDAGDAARRKMTKELEGLRQAASAVFDEMKTLDLQIAQLKSVVEAAEQVQLRDQLQRLEDSRQRMATRYDGYVEELGTYRKLNDNEKVVYKMARVFNESEFGMPAGFVNSVRDSIQNYWQGPAGRRRFAQAVQLAQREGYVSLIVKTMQEHGLPAQFFYLALQESDFNIKAVGPPTRWGRAKGMWQFIPTTALRYWLDAGPYADNKTVDPQDERHDLEKSTEAAARYLQTICSTLAQASGLLVIASYNWGEHRIVDKLEELPGPQTIPQEALEGIPEDPTSRNYWRFLGEYADRMPKETKDYVLKVFSAAVIGENPQQFGFDFDNPLAPYM